MIDTITELSTKLYVALVTLLHAGLTPTRKTTSFRLVPPRAVRAATFIEYAILAAIAVILGGIILIALKAVFAGAFTSVCKFVGTSC